MIKIMIMRAQRIRMHNKRLKTVDNRITRLLPYSLVVGGKPVTSALDALFDRRELEFGV